MTLAFLNLSWPTFADGLALGGIYALMAVGIGLVFGVLRLVNFAYGQLIMAGAYGLAYGATWNLPNWESILLCFGVVLALSLLLDRFVFRPLRLHSPAVMLVATFAVAFLLQNVALLKFGALPRSAGSLALLNAPWDIFGVEIKKIAVISIVTAAFRRRRSRTTRLPTPEVRARRRSSRHTEHPWSWARTTEQRR